MTGDECEKSSSIGKRKERNLKEDETDSVSMDAKKLNTGLSDSISLLSDDNLGNILSRLPTKLAASTSVLSKRWRNVFALVHNLDFDDSVFVKPVQNSDDALKCFKNFVNRTLALQCGSSIKKFSLNFQKLDKCEMASVCRWISNVLERGVLELYLCRRSHPEDYRHSYSHQINLPFELFRSKTLVKLTLGRNRYFEKLPSDLSLPALKSLFIESIFFECQEFFERLLVGCPVLEELSIRYVKYAGAPNCICSQTIKKLKVYYDIQLFLCWDLRPYITFDAPNLVSIDYTDIVRPEYIKVNLKSLVEAKLNLTYSGIVDRPDLTSLIIGISNVQTLHLSSNTVNAISQCYKHGLVLPVFNNLVNLSYGSCNEKGWKLLSHLLKKAPKLETLTIQSLDGYTIGVILHSIKVKVLHVLGYGNTDEEREHLIRFVWGTECLELVKVEIKKGVVVDHDIISQTLRMSLEVAAPKRNIKLEISFV